MPASSLTEHGTIIARLRLEKHVAELQRDGLALRVTELEQKLQTYKEWCQLLREQRQRRAQEFAQLEAKCRELATQVNQLGAELILQGNQETPK